MVGATIPGEQLRPWARKMQLRPWEEAALLRVGDWLRYVELRAPLHSTKQGCC